MCGGERETLDKQPKTEVYSKRNLVICTMQTNQVGKDKLRVGWTLYKHVIKLTIFIKTRTMQDQ